MKGGGSSPVSALAGVCLPEETEGGPARTDILSAGADIPDIPMSPGHPMRQVGLPRLIGLIFIVYNAPADRISVRAGPPSVSSGRQARSARTQDWTLGVWNRL